MSTLRAVLIGAALAILVVGGIVAAVWTHVLSTAPKPIVAPQSVVVAAVLPGTDDVVAPRLIDVYVNTASGWTVRSVSPSSAVEIPGTSGSTLADAYSFGGGRGLIDALSARLGFPIDAWVIVDEPAWRSLHGTAGLPLQLPADVEVYDGSQLYAFPSGVTTVSADQLPQLLAGSAFLTANGDARVRGQVGDAVGQALSTNGAASAGVLHSNLPLAALRTWLRGIGSARRIPGS